MIDTPSLRASSHPSLVTDLPGLNFKPSFNHYSGYVALPNSHKRLHYWFVESARSPSSDPVILWLTGGPGCSSMMAMLTENGPFRLEDDGKTISQNHQAWNNEASVIFLESPAGVGFSYSTDGVYNSTDATTAADNFAFLQGFFQEFTEFNQGQPFFLTGESYAGNYVPQLAEVIVDHQARAANGAMDHEAQFAASLNWKGFMIGNPTMDFADMSANYLKFMAAHAFISLPDMQEAESVCNGTFSPPPTKECSDIVDKLTLQTYGVDPYNIVALCEGDGWGTEPGCFTLNALSALARPVRSMHEHRTLLQSLSSAPPSLLGQTFVPCVPTDPLRSYLNDPAVMKALHVPIESLGGEPWDACSQRLHYSGMEGSVVHIYNKILSTRPDIRMLVYSGDVDSCVPYLSTEVTMLSIPFTSSTKQSRPWSSWTYVSAQAPKSIKQIGGKAIQWGNQLAFATVRGAGHMVPHDQPEAALTLFTSFLTDKVRLL